MRPSVAGDDDVLELLADNLAANTAAPATPARVSRLLWGSHDPLAALGLTSPPDLVLASDVVGNKSQTLNPEPLTPHPKPQALNPQP